MSDDQQSVAGHLICILTSVLWTVVVSTATDGTFDKAVFSVSVMMKRCHAKRRAHCRALSSRGRASHGATRRQKRSITTLGPSREGLPHAVATESQCGKIASKPITIDPLVKSSFRPVLANVIQTYIVMACRSKASG